MTPVGSGSQHESTSPFFHASWTPLLERFLGIVPVRSVTPGPGLHHYYGTLQPVFNGLEKSTSVEKLYLRDASRIRGWPSKMGLTRLLRSGTSLETLFMQGCAVRETMRRTSCRQNPATSNGCT